jgi:hypothetical protein
MEVFLLWIDELDDMLSAARHLAPKLLGFLFALALFAATVLALSITPHAPLVVAAVVLSATLAEAVRRRRRARAAEAS